MRVHRDDIYASMSSIGDHDACLMRMTEKVEHKMCMYWLTLTWLAVLSVCQNGTYLANTKARINFVSRHLRFVHPSVIVVVTLLPNLVKLHDMAKMEPDAPTYFGNGRQFSTRYLHLVHCIQLMYLLTKSWIPSHLSH